MAENNKRGFHAVEEPDMEEYERKLRKHRIKVVRRTIILIVIVLGVSAGLWVFMALRQKSLPACPFLSLRDICSSLCHLR